MKSFIISTDSCADYYRSQLCARDVHAIVLKRITNGVEQAELYDSDAEFERFFQEIKAGALPTTSLLNEFELKEYFEKLLSVGDGDIVHIPLSSGLSGTCQNAVAAAEELNQTLTGRKIYVVDSLSASRGIAMLVDRLVEMRDSGVAAADAVEAIVRMRDHQQVWAVIGDLKHLRRGGRISGFKAAIGTLLHIKPIITIGKNGKLVIERTVKGEKKAVEYLLDKLERFGASANPDFKNQTLYLIHSGQTSLLTALETAIRERFCGIKIDTGMIGPVIGTHVGDGTVGVIFEGAQRQSME